MIIPHITLKQAEGVTIAGLYILLAYSIVLAIKTILMLPFKLFNSEKSNEEA